MFSIINIYRTKYYTYTVSIREKYIGGRKMEHIPAEHPSRTKKYATWTGIAITVLIAICLIFAPDQFFRFLQMLIFFV